MLQERNKNDLFTQLLVTVLLSSRFGFGHPHFCIEVSLNRKRLRPRKDLLISGVEAESLDFHDS